MGECVAAMNFYNITIYDSDINYIYYAELGTSDINFRRRFKKSTFDTFDSDTT